MKSRKIVSTLVLILVLLASLGLGYEALLAQPRFSHLEGLLGSQPSPHPETELDAMKRMGTFPPTPTPEPWFPVNSPQDAIKLVMQNPRFQEAYRWYPAAIDAQGNVHGFGPGEMADHGRSLLGEPVFVQDLDRPGAGAYLVPDRGDPWGPNADPTLSRVIWTVDVINGQGHVRNGGGDARLFQPIMFPSWPTAEEASQQVVGLGEEPVGVPFLAWRELANYKHGIAWCTEPKDAFWVVSTKSGKTFYIFPKGKGPNALKGGGPVDAETLKSMFPRSQSLSPSPSPSLPPPSPTSPSQSLSPSSSP